MTNHPGDDLARFDHACGRDSRLPPHVTVAEAIEWLRGFSQTSPVEMGLRELIVREGGVAYMYGDRPPHATD